MARRTYTTHQALASARVSHGVPSNLKWAYSGSGIRRSSTASTAARRITKGAAAFVGSSKGASTVTSNFRPGPFKMEGRHEMANLRSARQARAKLTAARKAGEQLHSFNSGHTGRGKYGSALGGGKGYKAAQKYNNRMARSSSLTRSFSSGSGGYANSIRQKIGQIVTGNPGIKLTPGQAKFARDFAVSLAVTTAGIKGAEILRQHSKAGIKVRPGSKIAYRHPNAVIRRNSAKSRKAFAVNTRARVQRRAGKVNLRSNQGGGLKSARVGGGRRNFHPRRDAHGRYAGSW